MDVDGHEICDTQGSLYIFLPYGHFLFLEVVDSDPHSFGCRGSGSVLGIRIRFQEHGNWPKFTNKPGFLLSKAFVRYQYLLRHIFLTYLLLYFSCKNSFFCDLKVWPGSGSGFTWIRIGLAPWIRIRNTAVRNNIISDFLEKCRKLRPWNRRLKLSRHYRVKLFTAICTQTSCTVWPALAITRWRLTASVRRRERVSVWLCWTAARWTAPGCSASTAGTSLRSFSRSSSADVASRLQIIHSF